MINSIKNFEEKCINRFEKLEDEFMENLLQLAEYVTGLTENAEARLLEDAADELRKAIRSKTQKKFVDIVGQRKFIFGFNGAELPPTIC